MIETIDSETAETTFQRLPDYQKRDVLSWMVSTNEGQEWYRERKLPSMKQVVTMNQSELLQVFRIAAAEIDKRNGQQYPDRHLSGRTKMIAKERYTKNT